MMFLFAVPIWQAMGLYFVPLMIGTRNVAFPRLNAFGYYIYLLGGITLFGSLFLNIGVDTGWFSYVPLAGPEFAPGKRVDLWAQMVSLTEIAALVAAVEIIATTFKQRAPGMSLNRLPVFVWGQVITSFMVIFAMPSVMLVTSMLATGDRLGYISTHFFNQAEGGDPLLWQHLFWFFGHPEVYIIFIPATAFISLILPEFARRKAIGYPALVLSLLATAFIGFGVWVHHMFATPVSEMGQSFFTASSMLITVPTGLQLFCWIATLWTGKPQMKTPLIFILGFFANFVVGGLTGVMLASSAVDIQVHDTFFVVAHLHYVLIGGSVFPLFAAFYYWFPKWTGRMLSERVGKWNFWLLFYGFNLTFFPMHQLGLQGMTRRIYTYAPETGWGTLNLIATIGAATIGLSVLTFIANVLWSRKHGLVAGPNPWGAASLEWATSSPPPSYNFLHVPTVKGLYPLWEQFQSTPVVTGLATAHREVLVTSTLDAVPDHRYHLPGDSIWPPLLAVVAAVPFVASVFHPAYFLLGVGLVFLVLFGWFWQGAEPHEPVSAELKRPQLVPQA